MVQGTHTHWRMTINNYDATDLALVQQGYPDDIRQLVYTLEEGEEGTPHIQAFIKMKRDVRMSHMKKLFPRGNFGTMDSAEWRLNQQRYAQKLDATARSPAVITNWDPLHTIEGTLRRVIEAMCPDIEMEGLHERQFYEFLRKRREGKMVEEDYTLAKVFVSSTYRAMWRDYGVDMVACILKRREAEREAHVEIPTTHTHTHTREKNFLAEGVNAAEGNDAQGGEDSQESGVEEEDCEGDEDSSSACSADSAESGGFGYCSQDDSEESGEQSGWQSD